MIRSRAVNLGIWLFQDWRQVIVPESGLISDEFAGFYLIARKIMRPVTIRTVVNMLVTARSPITTVPACPIWDTASDL